MNKPILITLNQIKSRHPYSMLWSKALKANGGSDADYDKPFTVSSILESNDFSDTLWVLGCLPEHLLMCRRFAWWCATQVVDTSKVNKATICLSVVDRFIKMEATEEELTEAWEEAWASDNYPALFAARAAAGRHAASGADSAAFYASESYAESCAISADPSACWFTAKASAKSAFMLAQQEKLNQILDAGQWIDD